MGERFSLAEILPGKENFANLRIVRELQLELAPTEEEWKRYGMKEDKGQIHWKLEMASLEKDIRIGNKAHTIVREALEKLDNEKVGEMKYLTLYEKFVKED